MAVGSENDIYITGESSGGGTDNEMVTFKYDPDGDRLWWRSDLRVSGIDIAVDSSDSVVVIGGDPYSASFTSYIVKYRSDGYLLWTYEIEKASMLTVAVDKYDCIYALGQHSEDDRNPEIFTLKLDPSGNRLWSNTREGPDRVINWAVDIDIDPFGDAVQIGPLVNAESEVYDIGIDKYDSNGNLLWSKRIEEMEVCDMAIDAAGYIHLSCALPTDKKWEFKYATLKLSPSGNIVWLARFDGSNLCEGGEGVHSCEYFGDDDDTAPGDDDDDSGCGC